MDEEVKGKYIKAGQIAKKAREYAIEITKPGKNYFDICESVEKFIKENGGEIGFPTNISVNENAAHDTAIKGDDRIVDENDVVKIDIGTHVDGYVGDTACTVHWNPEYDDLVNASKNALQEALKLCKPGVKVYEISEVIEQTIKNAGFKPIKNLTGHGLERYFLHADPQIPNVSTKNDYEIQREQVIAIEPFATTMEGAGEIKESNEKRIYMMVDEKPVRNRNARIVLNKIKGYNNLPFATRWLPLSGFNLRMALMELERKGIVYDYPVLKEINGTPISQFEHSILIDDKPIILTK